MKKLLISLICSLSVFTFVTGAKADKQDQTHEVVNIYMFTKEGCSICETAAKYFSELSADKEYGEMFNLITLRVYDNEWNIASQEFYDTAIKLARKMGDKFNGTPYIIVGEKSFNGFKVKYDEQIKEEIKRCYEKGYKDPLVNIDSKDEAKDPDKGIKIFINILTFSIAGSLTIAFIISRLPKKSTFEKPKKEVKKTPNKQKEIKAVVKRTPKEERIIHNAPKKSKSSDNKNKQKK